MHFKWNNNDVLIIIFSLFSLLVFRTRFHDQSVFICLKFQLLNSSVSANTVRSSVFLFCPSWAVCRRVHRVGLSPGLLQWPGAAVYGPQQPGHRGDRAGPPPLSAGASRLPEPHWHRRTATRPHRLRSPQPQDRILPGILCRLNVNCSKTLMTSK